MRQPPVMHHHRIDIPEIDSGQIARQNLLGFRVVRAPLFDVTRWRLRRRAARRCADWNSGRGLRPWERNSLLRTCS